MPISSEINTEQRRVYTTCGGFITLPDFTHYQNTVWTNFDLYGFDELFDTRQADFSGMTHGDLLTVASNEAKLQTLAPDSTVAIVVTPGKHEELMKFYQVAKGAIPVPSRTIKLFTSLDDAMAFFD
jgi:hypothetical protein